MGASAPSGLRKGGQRLVDFLLLLVTFVPLFVFFLFLGNHLSMWFCPAKTFMAGPLSGFGQFASSGLLAWSLSYLIQRGLFLLAPGLVRAAGYPAAYKHTSKPGSWPAFWLKLAAIVAVLSVPWMLANAATEFCLSAGGIGYRPAPWDDARHYRWDDVVAIQTSCVRGARGRWSVSYDVGLRDGTYFDIATAANEWKNGYPRLAHALAGRHVAFDSSRVAPDCGASVEVLRTPLL